MHTKAHYRKNYFSMYNMCTMQQQRAVHILDKSSCDTEQNQMDVKDFKKNRTH